MILKKFTEARANKLSKKALPAVKDPIGMEFLWLQYEDFSSPTPHFNNKLHKHTFYELHMILEGGGIISDNNQKQYAVHAGEAIMIPQSLPHVFQHQDENLKRFSVAFTMQKDIMSTNIFSDFITVTLQENVIENLNTIFMQADKNTVLSLHIIKNRLFELLCEMLNIEECTDAPPVESNTISLYINKSKKYIADNLNIVLTCKNIADYCHINEIYLNRIFKEYTGETLLRYIHRKKIDYSIELLKNRELSLGEISAMLGFSNEYHFNTFFKKSVGMPPGAYRNINSNAE